MTQLLFNDATWLEEKSEKNGLFAFAQKAEKPTTTTGSRNTLVGQVLPVHGFGWFSLKQEKNGCLTFLVLQPSSMQKYVSENIRGSAVR